MSRRAAVLGRVWRLSWRADWRTVLALFPLMVLAAGMPAATGLSQRWLVDTAVAGSAAGLTLAIAVGALALGLGTAAGRFETNLRLYLLDRVQLALTQDVLHAAAVIPTIGHLERPDYLDRLERLRWGTWGLASSGWQVASVAVAILSLTATAVLLTIVDQLLFVLVVFAVPSLLASRRSARIMRAVYDSTAQASRWERRWHELSVRPETAKELYVSGSASDLDQRADALWHETTTRTTAARVRATGWELGGWCGFAAGFAAALLVVADRVAAGDATLGEAVLVMTLASQLQGQLARVVNEIAQLAAAGSILDHYAWVREHAATHPRGEREAPRRLAEGIALTGVSFRYPGGNQDVLRDVELFLPAGSTVALVGVNGAGKSTLVKLLTGMYQPTQGRILVDGSPLADLRPESWQASVCAAFQDFVRFQLPAGETVGVGDLPRLQDEPAIQAALGRAGAAELPADLPQGLRTQLGRAFDGVEPSLGQWQKLALGRALMRRTPLLAVLDEPTAALDPLAEHELFTRFVSQIRELVSGHGTVTVLVSHRFSTTRMADLVVVVDQGQVEELGSHDELMRRGGVYAGLYQAQAVAYLGESANLR